MDFNNSKTKNNLARAFAGECQDGARYQFISKQAESDGLNYLSSLMKTLAKNEMAHAKVFYDHLVCLGGGKLANIEICAGYPFEEYDLKNSLRTASEVELSENKNIYPSFAKIARDEGFNDVADSFELVALVENCHYKQLSELEQLRGNKEFYVSAEKKKWKCSNCGHEHVSKSAWKVCPLCSSPQGYVIIQLSDE